MTIQARASEWDHRLYNVGRDCAHNFGEVCAETARRIEEQDWPAINRMLAAAGVGDDELGEACRAFLEFVATATADRSERQPRQVLARVGWFALSDTAQIAFLAVLGTVQMGYFFAGVREATLGGEGPLQHYPDLKTAGRQTAIALAVPRWRRRFYVWRYRARLWLLGRLGGTAPVTALTGHLDYNAQARILRDRLAGREEPAAPPQEQP